jgi:glycosyltransferase involved in cell wall biosynthesis
MPTTEGVSASLFEAMACNCYPIVSNIAGNQSWITHRNNGQLITVDDSEMLAEKSYGLSRTVHIERNLF